MCGCANRLDPCSGAVGRTPDPGRFILVLILASGCLTQATTLSDSAAEMRRRGRISATGTLLATTISPAHHSLHDQVAGDASTASATNGCDFVELIHLLVVVLPCQIVGRSYL